MPLYEYKCHSCGKTFEVLQKFSDEPIKVHDECGGEVERLLSAPAFHLKGTGWYATDYAKGNGGAAKSTESKSGDSKSSDGKSESSGDSKPASDAKSGTDTKSPESKPATVSTPDAK